MPPDFATELARKCVQDWEEYGTIHADLHLYIAAAMREALEEAETATRCERCHAAIAALREGRDD